jgi:predicted permease
MRRLSHWWRRLTKSRIRANVDDEIQFHFQERIDALIAEGLPRAEAAARARDEFGNPEDVRRRLTAIDRRMASGRRWSAWRDLLSQDLRHAVRALRAAPALTGLVVVTLALGIGANAATFSLVDRLFLRPPAGVGDPEQLVRLYQRSSGPRGVARIHYPGFDAIVTRLPPDMSATAYSTSRTPIGRGETPPLTNVAWVAPRYFSVVRAGAPALGRYFTDVEAAVEASSALAVISFRQWMARYDGDADVIGTRIELSHTWYTIIGVAPRGFSGIDVDAVDYWATMGAWLPRTTPPWYHRTNRGLRVLIRAPDRSHEHVGDIATAAYRAGVPTRGSPPVLLAGPVSEARGPAPWSTEITISTRLVGVAVAVLLIACANAGNLLLARAMQRRGEIAIRLALGITRARLLRLFLVESFVLSCLAAVVSLLVAAWGGAALRELLLPDVTWTDPVLGVRVLAATFGIAIATTLLTGLPPAWRAGRSGLTPALRSGARDTGGPRSRLRTTLLVTQLALSLVLLVGAVAFVRSLMTVRSARTGYDIDSLLLVRLRYDDGAFRRDRTAELLEHLVPQLRAHPGVAGAALSGMAPLSGWFFRNLFRQDGSPIPDASYTTVSPGFFRASGIQLLRGRDFDAGDTRNGARVMVVNEAMARAFWPGEDAMGQCARIEKASEPCVSVVGLVENTHRDGLIDENDGQAPMYFVPLAQDTGEFAAPSLAVVRSAERSLSKPLIDGLRADLRRALPPGVYASVEPLAGSFSRQLRPFVLGSTLFAVFGVLALIVASVGTYSALAYAVSRRTREMGIRLALGAPPVNLLRLVVAEGLRPVMIGIGAGLLIAIVSGRAIAAMLYRTSASDPLVLVVSAAALAAVAALGCLVPGLRATRVDPIAVLRSE